MPPELIRVLGIQLPLKRRDPHYFLPTTDGRYLLFGSDQEATKAQFQKFFSEQDWRANCKLLVRPVDCCFNCIFVLIMSVDCTTASVCEVIALLLVPQ